MSRRKNFVIVLLVASAAAGMSMFALRARKPVIADPGAQPVRIAEAAVAAFHDRLNGRQHEAACKSASPDAFAGITGLSCKDFLEHIRTRLGAVADATRSELPLIEDAPASKAVRVAIDYETRFHTETAREHFEWRITGDAATLIGYRVSATAVER